MKKILGICLSLAMLAALFIPSAYAQEGQARAQAPNEVEQFMTAFGIVPDGADAAVTREDFAAMLYQVLSRSGLPDAGGDLILDDVDSANPNAAAIRSVAFYGYMRGDLVGENHYRFRPTDAVLQSEVVKVLVELVNYGSIAYYKGGYPSGYAVVARSIGILSGVNYNGEAPADLTAVKNMLYNALRCDIAVEDEYQSGSATYNTHPGETYLTQNWKVFETSGPLSANSMINTNGLSPMGENRVKIGDSVYESDLIYENNLCLGQFVTAYYEKDKRGSEKIVCMYPQKNKSDRIVVRSEDVNRTDTLSSIEVWNGTRYQVCRMSETADVYYNFSYLGPVRALNSELVPVAEMLGLLGEQGSCEIILTDNTGDGRYDFVWVRNYENYLLKEFTYAEYKVSDVYDRTLKMRDAFDQNNVVLLDEQGGLFSPNDFEPNDVITMIVNYQGDEVSAAVGYVSKRLASGAITAIKDGKFQIGDEWYTASREYQKLEEANSSRVMELKLGLDTSFYISALGEIVGASKAEAYETGIVYAFVIQAAVESGLDRRVTLRALNQNGEVISYPLDSNVTLNGIRTAQEKQFAFFTRLAGTAGTTSMCNVYRLGKLTLKEGLVTKLELEVMSGDAGAILPPSDGVYAKMTMTSGGTVSVVQDNGAVETTAGTLQDIVYKSNTFGKMVGVSSSTTVFEVPSRIVRQSAIDNAKPANGETPDEARARAKAEEESRIAQGLSDQNAFYTSSANSFQGDCALGVSGQKKLNPDDDVFIRFYDLDNTSFAAVVIRFYTYTPESGGAGGVPETQGDCITVESIGDGLNADGEKVKVISGYQAGSAVSFSTTPIRNTSNPWDQFSCMQTLYLDRGDGVSIPVETLQPGDAVQVSTNAKGEITDMIVNMRGGNKEEASWLKEDTNVILSGHGNQYLGVNYGVIQAYEDGKVVLKEIDGRTRVYSLGSPAVTVYSRRNDQVRKGSLQDIELGDDLFIRQYYSQVKEVVIYQD